MINIINKIKQNPVISMVIFLLLLSLIVGLAIGLRPKPASSIKNNQRNIQRYGAADTGSYFLKSDNSGNLSLYDPATTAFSSKELNSTGNINVGGNIQLNNTNRILFANNPTADQGTIQYSKWDSNKLELVGGGTPPSRSVRIYDQLCIGNTCINGNDLANIKNGIFPQLTTGQITINHLGVPIILNNTGGTGKKTFTEYRENGTPFASFGVDGNGNAWGGTAINTYSTGWVKEPKS